MRIFKGRKDQYAAVQTVSAAENSHPFSELLCRRAKGHAEFRLYKALREAVPIIDAAICKIVRLVGGFCVKCEDESLSEQMNQFLREVKVNSCEQGTESFVASYLDQMLMFGTAVGEMVPNFAGDELVALYNAPLSSVELLANDNPLDMKVCKRDKDGNLRPLKNQDLILVTAMKPEPGEIFGTSLLKGLPFVSSILLNIYNSVGVNWDRVGNVRFAVTYKPGNDAGEKAYAKERAEMVAQEWQKTMHAGSTLSDFVAVGDVDIKVIGADNQVLDSQVPVRQMLEQIVAKLSIPPFLLGLSWSTSERMSTQQADILTSELEFYRKLLSPVITRICYMWQRLCGVYSPVKVVWDNINLQDEVELANARLLEARAREIEQCLQ